MISFSEAIVYAASVGPVALALVLLIRRRGAVRGLTLTGPWWWSVIALVTLAAVETLATFHSAYAKAAVSEPLRFVALMSLFTPLMSLMGAKRPQDGAWHFIVVSLWGILALPAAETLFLQRGQALEVYDARGWFLLALIVISALNLGLVRWWPSALLVALAEIVMLAEYLPAIQSTSIADFEKTARMAAGCCLLAAAVLLLVMGVPRRGMVSPWDRLWLDFRDVFGALWAIRVAEQVNQVAEKQQWDFRLHWAGFRSATSGEPLQQSPFEQHPPLVQVVENLFRRFVNAEWIESRLGKSLAELKSRL